MDFCVYYIHLFALFWNLNAQLNYLTVIINLFIYFEVHMINILRFLYKFFFFILNACTCQSFTLSPWACLSISIYLLSDYPWNHWTTGYPLKCAKLEGTPCWNSCVELIRRPICIRQVRHKIFVEPLRETVSLLRKIGEPRESK